jgi:hypothetical protein
VEIYFSSASSSDTDESANGYSTASDLSSNNFESPRLLDCEDFYVRCNASAASVGSPMMLVKKPSMDGWGGTLKISDDGFASVLDQALMPESTLKSAILKQSALIYADETFRFYAAILEWERLVKDDQKTFR